MKLVSSFIFLITINNWAFANSNTCPTIKGSYKCVVHVERTDMRPISSKLDITFDTVVLNGFSDYYMDIRAPGWGGTIKAGYRADGVTYTSKSPGRFSFGPGEVDLHHSSKCSNNSVITNAYEIHPIEGRGESKVDILQTFGPDKHGNPYLNSITTMIWPSGRKVVETERLVCVISE